jgi:NADPH:quinone reductase
MSKAIVVHATGGPEVLQWCEHDPGVPGRGQLRVRQDAVGLNFIDVYFRNGTYSVPTFPYVPGSEGAGTVIEAGPDTSGFEPGDCVAYCSATGTYAEEIVVEAARVIRLPDSMDTQTAAAIMLKGLTAEYLLRRTHDVGPGTVMLFHAAAGGVGLIACQWAKALGATVIGTAGSDDKCELALQHGCDHVINYREEDFAARVAQITGGQMCEVVYDSVGRDTFPRSLDCLKKRGLWVSFGQSSGKVPPFDIGLLNSKGSLFATRPNLQGYNTTRSEFEMACKALFDVVASGEVKVGINQRYPLEEARKAHLHLEQRRTTGASILMP